MNRVFKLIIILLAMVAYTGADGQVHTVKSVQLTGVVLDVDNHEPVPYVNISIEGTQYGTSADNSGYFSLFVNPGDILNFSSIGYRDAIFIMPHDITDAQYSLVQLMRTDTVMLSEVVVFPWPTIQQFEKAFLDTKPKRNMDDLVFEVKRDIRKTVADNQLNEYYHEQMQYNRLYQLHQQIPPNNFLNPIRWSNFIRDLRSSEFEEDQ